MSNKIKLATPELKELTVSFRDEEYIVPAPKMWPLEVVEAQERNQNMAALKELLGSEQFKRFRNAAKTLGDLEEFMESLFDAADVTRGE